MNAALDHLVVAAPALDDGVAWCEATFGVTPAPGGAHPLFGTHNRLLRLEAAAPAYLEVIAIDPAATPTRVAPLRRWFDLDNPGLQAGLRQHGPRLVHWVVRVDDIALACQAWQALGLDPGPVIAASRATPTGLLRWQITVPDDGRRGMGGVLPTLIQWQGTHPAHGLPDNGLCLDRLALAHPQADALRAALAAIGLPAPVDTADAPGLRAHCTRGARAITLESLPA